MSFRIIDLRVNWLLQYVGEITTFDPHDYPDIKPRLGEVSGYLQDTLAAIIPCGRSSADWAKQTDPDQAISEIFTRVEAEFPGRILIGPDDYERFASEPHSLCWAILQLDDLDKLIKPTDATQQLSRWFDRGVRIFRLTDLAQLDLLAQLGSVTGPKPAVDLGGLDPESVNHALNWFDADPSRRARLFPMISHLKFDFHDFSIKRLRKLSGLVGLALGPSATEFCAQIEPLNEEVSGIALSSGYLGGEAVASTGLGTVEEVIRSLTSRLDDAILQSIGHQNAWKLIRHVTSG